MALKKVCQLGILLLSAFLIILPAHADNPFGQFISIDTHFNCISGSPSWLLILKDIDTGQVIPYQYDIHEENNAWVAFSYGRAYQITVSTLTFGPFAILHNFCGLENLVFRDTSLNIHLTGALTPDRFGFQCERLPFKNMSFTIVNAS